MIVRPQSIPLLLLLLHVTQATLFPASISEYFSPSFGVVVELRVSGRGTKDYIDHDWKMKLVRLCLSEDGRQCWGRKGPIIGMTKRPWLAEITAKEFAEHGWSMTFINRRTIHLPHGNFTLDPLMVHPWKKYGKKYLLVNKGYFDRTSPFEIKNTSLFTGTTGPNTIEAFGLTVQVSISCPTGTHGDSCERACEPATGLHICDERLALSVVPRFVSCEHRCEHRFTGICVEGPPDYCGFDSESIRLLINDYPNRLYGGKANVPSPLPDHVRNLMNRTLAKYPDDARVAKGNWKAYIKLPWPTAAPDTVNADSPMPPPANPTTPPPNA